MDSASPRPDKIFTRRLSGVGMPIVYLGAKRQAATASPAPHGAA